MRPNKSQAVIQPDYPAAPRRDATKLAGLERLWDIFRMEAAPGRAGSYYALEHGDDPYGGHVEGGPVDRLFRSSDLIGLVADGAQAVLHPKAYAKAARDRADKLNELPDLDDKVSVIGRFPKGGPLGPMDPIDAGGELRRKAAQVAGIATRDTMTQGWQSAWWLINALQAGTGLAAQQAQRGVLGASKGVQLPFLSKRVLAREAVSPGTQLPKDIYKMPGASISSSIPLIGLAGLISGNLLRKPGYKAVFPETTETDGEDYDTSQSVNLPGEILMRTLGWKGNLRGYGDFSTERPDVTHAEFMKYSAYLQNRSPIKATAEGIHGPEVTLFGSSVPLLTGVIPLAAGLVGARRGMRMAGNRLAGRGWRGLEAPGTIPTTVTIAGQKQVVPDRFKQSYDLHKEAEDLGEKLGGGHEDAVAARVDARRVQSEIDREKLVGVLVGSSLLGGTTALATQGLEAFRQANNWEENRGQVAADVAEALKERAQDRERIRLDGLAGLIP